MSIRTFAAVTALLASTSVCADPEDTFTLQPPAVAAGQPAQLRIDSPDGCYPADSVSIETSSGVIAVRFTLSDTSPCAPSWTTPQFVALGAFASGSYQVRVTECTNSPIDPCTLRETLQLTVGGGVPEATPVPTLSQVAALVLALAFGCIAWLRMRGATGAANG